MAWRGILWTRVDSGTTHKMCNCERASSPIRRPLLTTTVVVVAVPQQNKTAVIIIIFVNCIRNDCELCWWGRHNHLFVGCCDFITTGKHIATAKETFVPHPPPLLSQPLLLRLLLQLMLYSEYLVCPVRLQVYGHKERP